MNLKRLLPIYVATVAVLCCLNSTVYADEEADRAALRLILTNYMDAVNSGQVSKLAPFLSKEVTVVMVTGEEVKGLEGLEAYWKKIQDLIGPGGSYHVTVNVDKTDFYGEAAISRGNTEDVVRLGNGKELPFSSRWTSVCRKEDGAWRVIRMQAAMNPVDNVFISLKGQRDKLAFGIGGVVAGVIINFAIQFLRRGRKCEPQKAPG